MCLECCIRTNSILSYYNNKKKNAAQKTENKKETKQKHTAEYAHLHHWGLICTYVEIGTIRYQTIFSRTRSTQCYHPTFSYIVCSSSSGHPRRGQYAIHAVETLLAPASFGVLLALLFRIFIVSLLAARRRCLLEEKPVTLTRQEQKYGRRVKKLKINKKRIHHTKIKPNKISFSSFVFFVRSLMKKNDNFHPSIPTTRVAHVLHRWYRTCIRCVHMTRKPAGDHKTL